MAAKYEKTILITGGTSGLGYHCALHLAKRFPNYQVAIASRSDRDNAAMTINKATGNQNTTSISNVRQFARAFKSSNYPPITALLLNAGLQFDKLNYSKDGFESTFAVNHVGNTLLFFLLRDHLENDARIVLTASGTHDPAQKTGMPDAVYNSAEELAHPTAETAKNPGGQRYSTSKLCNVLWTYALDRRLREVAIPHGKRWTVVAFDPGLMPGTGLARDLHPILRFIWINILPRILPLMRLLLGPNIHTPEQSGENLARLAVGEDVKAVSGKYFEGHKEIKSSKESYSLSKQDDLWDWTLKHITQDKAEVAEFEQL